MARDIVFDLQGAPAPTERVVLADVSELLWEKLVFPGLTEREKDRIVALSITCEGHDVRLAFGGTVPSSELGHLLEAGQATRPSGSEMVRTLRCCNAAAGQVAILTVTAEYNKVR